LPEGTAYVSEGRFFRRGRDATSGGDDEDPALSRALACEETRWASGTWSPDRAVRDLRLHDVVVVLGGDPIFARMGDVAPGSRVLFDGVVHETRIREGSIEAHRTDVVLSEVVTTYVHDADALVEIEVVSADGAAQTIVGTPEHPVFVPARESFVPLGDLRPGATLRTTAGGDAMVRRVRAIAEGAPVYNIEVAHTHTYFAGGHALARGEVLVHNKGGSTPPSGGGPLAVIPPRQIEATWGMSTYRHGGFVSSIQHTMYRHAASSGHPRVSRFAAGTSVRDVARLVDHALRYGIVTPNGPGGYRVLHTFGSAIGTDRFGRTTNLILIYVRDGTIRSAHPL